MPTNLTEISQWSHKALADVLSAGDLAIDLTAGNGKDTLFLWRAIGHGGFVVGFDIQPAALVNAETFLRKAGARVAVYDESVPERLYPGVHLVRADHARWAEFVAHPTGAGPKAIIANLGYLPGGDKELVTDTASTQAALRTGLERLEPGGRLAVVSYVGHPGGREEADAVEALFSELPPQAFRVLRIANPKAQTSPFLLVAEKIDSPK